MTGESVVGDSQGGGVAVLTLQAVGVCPLGNFGKHLRGHGARPAQGNDFAADFQTCYILGGSIVVAAGIDQNNRAARQESCRESIG